MDKCKALAHPLPTLAALAPTSSPLQQQRFFAKATSPAPEPSRIVPSSQAIRRRNSPVKYREVPTEQSDEQQLDAAAQASLPHRNRALWCVWRHIARHRVHRDARRHRENPHPSRRPQHRLHRLPPRTAAPCAASATPGLPITDAVLTAPAGAPQPRCASPPAPLGIHRLPDIRSRLPAPNRVTSTAICLFPHQHRTRQRPHRYSHNYFNRRVVLPIRTAPLCPKCATSYDAACEALSWQATRHSTALHSNAR